MAETFLVGTFLPASSVALTTQGSAPPPFDVFHDLRWIVVYHESWFGFAAELLGGLAVRSALLTVLVRAAWPHGMVLEPVAVTVRRSVIYVAVVSILLAPWVGLVFALAVVSLSWLFFVAVPVVLMLAVLVAGGAVTGSWWRRALSWRVAGIVVLTFVAITVFGSLLATLPSWWRVTGRGGRRRRERVAVGAARRCSGARARVERAGSPSSRPRSRRCSCW